MVVVDTAPFWDHDIDTAEPKQGAYNEIVGTAPTLTADGTLDTQWLWGYGPKQTSDSSRSEADVTRWCHRH
jgi:hypothetical protein